MDTHKNPFTLVHPKFRCAGVCYCTNLSFDRHLLYAAILSSSNPVAVSCAQPSYNRRPCVCVISFYPKLTFWVLIVMIKHLNFCSYWLNFSVNSSKIIYRHPRSTETLASNIFYYPVGSRTKIRVLNDLSPPAGWRKWNPFGPYWSRVH